MHAYFGDAVVVELLHGSLGLEEVLVLVGVLASVARTQHVLLVRVVVVCVQVLGVWPLRRPLIQRIVVRSNIVGVDLKI